VGADAIDGNGAYLSGGGAWTNGSSREFKENFQTLDGKELLQRISAMPIQAWEYKGTGERHIWPCAEDFHEQFDVGVLQDDGTRDTKYLAAGDIAGVALVGVQELYRMTGELEKKSEELARMTNVLQQKSQQLDELQAEVAQLRSLVETLLADKYRSGEGGDKLAVGE
jgi:hypothetical protein